MQMQWKGRQSEGDGKSNCMMCVVHFDWPKTCCHNSHLDLVPQRKLSNCFNLTLWMSLSACLSGGIKEHCQVSPPASHFLGMIQVLLELTILLHMQCFLCQ